MYPHNNIRDMAEAIWKNSLWRDARMRSVFEMNTGSNSLSAPMGTTQLASAYQCMSSDNLEMAADWHIGYQTLLIVSMPDMERGCLGICSCGYPAVTRMDFGASAAESGRGNSGYKDEGKTAENAICLSSEATYTFDMSE
jgi:hypothetical protein